MLVLVFLTLVAAATATSRCSSCSGVEGVMQQKACYIFCGIDQDGDQILTQDEVVALWTNYNGGQPVERHTFVQRVMQKTGACENEAAAVFYRFARAHPSTNPETIDLDDARAVFYRLTNNGQMTFVSRHQFYSAFGRVAQHMQVEC